jgi:hypothetical protein
VIDVLGRFRSQTNIMSFFKGSSGPKAAAGKLLTDNEKTELKKRGFIVPKLRGKESQ